MPGCLPDPFPTPPMWPSGTTLLPSDLHRLFGPGRQLGKFRRFFGKSLVCFPDLVGLTLQTLLHVLETLLHVRHHLLQIYRFHTSWRLHLPEKFLELQCAIRQSCDQLVDPCWFRCPKINSISTGKQADNSLSIRNSHQCSLETLQEVHGGTILSNFKNHCLASFVCLRCGGIRTDLATVHWMSAQACHEGCHGLRLTPNPTSFSLVPPDFMN